MDPPRFGGTNTLGSWIAVLQRWASSRYYVYQSSISLFGYATLNYDITFSLCMLKHVQIRAAALSYQDGLPSPNRDSDRNQNVIQAIKSGTSMPTRRQVQAEAPAREIMEVFFSFSRWGPHGVGWVRKENQGTPLNHSGSSQAWAKMLPEWGTLRE